ncbi:Ankyrin repeats (3 copies) [Vibrio ruber DSM 16370]|uniref:Ankyrin repeats (3 copies) n=1 Tax=Vibrio ruber (strain DSM 16370 / JCM 11486 / BCRC 17186 / CECT 7878 / LMG 23124 / VR1) TaxID=1123498 RepID=A0A1R4LG11_VIBR1|nr:ankyrin repeat domain-containing protein [Vibrio ruber]SJN55511.1 Ankyrin repeats (3 copies) [Vibrio ruber DSM 16370]
MSYEYELYDAVLDGDIDEVRALIDKGADIHEITESEHWTYLHHVFISPSTKREERTPLESVQFLIDQGLDVNAIDSYGYTPLLFAVRQRNVEGMRLLLENGADKLIGHRNEDGVDALKMAFDRKPSHFDVVKLLLEYGADPDDKREGGRSVRELLNIIVGVDSEIIELVNRY